MIEKIIFASRWIQAPMYLGLVAAGVMYAVKFLMELWHLYGEFGHLDEGALMLGVLGLVDITLVANLIVMVIVGGYYTFVSKIDLTNSEDKPEWLEKVDASTLKIKMATSLVGVSAVHLLKSFVNIDHVSYEQVAWQIGIHFTFLMSALLLAITERVLYGKQTH